MLLFMILLQSKYGYSSFFRVIMLYLVNSTFSLELNLKKKNLEKRKCFYKIQQYKTSFDILIFIKIGRQQTFPTQKETFPFRHLQIIFVALPGTQGIKMSVYLHIKVHLKVLYLYSLSHS